VYPKERDHPPAMCKGKVKFLSLVHETGQWY